MTARRVVILFLLFGTAWILISDHVLDLLIADASHRTAVQSVKGVVFVLLSALLIYVLVARAEKTQAATRAEVVREKDRLAQILNINPAVIYSLKPVPEGDSGFVVDFVGHNVEALTGYSVAQWMASPEFWRAHLHPDDVARADQAQAQLITDGFVSHEYRFLHADGSYFWVNDHVLLLRDASGRTLGVMGSWLNVTDRKSAELAINESEQRYRALFESSPLPMWVYDRETLRFLSVNDAAINRYGYSRAEFLAMTIRDIRPADDFARLDESIAQRDRSTDAYSRSGEWRHRRKDGTSFWVEISAHNLCFEERPARLILAQDITDRHSADERQRLIAQVFQSSQEGIFITDAQSRFVSVNQTFTRVTGYSMEELAGNTPRILRSGRHDQAFYQAMWTQIQQEGRWEGEIWNRRRTGDVYPEWLTISAIQDTNGRATQYLGIFTETSSRKAAEERIHRLANFDILTNLPNRTLLHDRAKVAIAAATRNQFTMAVMHLNVDRFKNVNDTFGHEAGDRVLVTLAQRLSAELNQDDTVSRTGADDFIILLPNTTARNMAQTALRILACVAEPFNVAGQDMRLTASIGIAEFPDNGSDLLLLTRAAESAVQQAKREGRNTFHFFSRGLQAQMTEAVALENDLRYAVERQELVLHYQPQVDIDTHRIIGAEALVRWQHPQRGLVPPGLFIPIAEESGLIREIGNWVLVEALRQNASWSAQGLPRIPVAVNLSVVQFRHAGLKDSIIEALRQSGLPAAMLELELTESVAMEDSNFTITTIDSLKRLGVLLSIDDFGTGYSSLSYLKRFDVDKLKIDQSFVRGLNYDPDDEAIVATVISLAKSLGLRTIAEGVETQAQLDFLRTGGCQEYQGYLFSRPVPAAEFALLLSRNAAELAIQ